MVVVLFVVEKFPKKNTHTIHTAKSENISSRQLALYYRLYMCVNTIVFTGCHPINTIQMCNHIKKSRKQETFIGACTKWIYFKFHCSILINCDIWTCLPFIKRYCAQQIDDVRRLFLIWSTIQDDARERKKSVEETYGSNNDTNEEKTHQKKKGKAVLA